jgi:hypothetical protein
MPGKNLDKPAKTALHPSGVHIDFYSTPHIYKVRETGQVLESGTTFIGRFFPKFDARAVAAKCTGRGKYKDQSIEDILAGWAAEGLRGRTEGEHLHYYLECMRKGTFPLPEPQTEREAGLFAHGAVAVMRYEESFQWVGAEVIIAAPDLGLAGMIDDWMFDPASGEHILNDWKQNKEIKTANPWDDCLPPIQHLEACDWVKYCLQLNLYRFIVEREMYGTALSAVPRVRMALTHITDRFARPKKVPDMQAEIRKMILWRAGAGQ